MTKGLGLKNTHLNKDGDSTIQNADAKLTALLNAAVDAMIIINHKGEIELFNHAAEKVFGYTQSDVLGQNVKMLMPEPYKQSHDEYLSRYQQSKEAKIIGTGRQVRAKKANGEIFPIYLSVGEVKRQGTPQYVGIIRDISEQEKNRLEAQESRERLSHVARLNTMGEMAAGIAHEINQPLSAISVYSEACKRMLKDLDSVPPKLVSTLEKIGDQAHRASEVISHLREFVKTRRAQLESVELNHLINETIDLAKLDTRIVEFEVSIKLYPGKIFIAADMIQIQQVLLNLIRNAIDAMEALADGELTIESRQVLPDSVEVVVSDNGRGIDEQSLKDIFTPFHTTKETGMGMGLPISQTIIHAHGGTLTFKERRPRGTEFVFRLPATFQPAKT